MNKTEVKMNKLVYLGLSIWDTNKIAMYEYWYAQTIPKCGDKTKLCYMDTDSFIVQIKSEDVYLDLSENVETIFDISNYEVERPLPMGKSKKVK